MIQTTTDYYAVLGVAPNESNAGICARYRDLAVRAHSRPSPVEPAALAFEDLAKAYSVLSDTSRKHAYDERFKSSMVEQTGAMPVEPVPAGEINTNSVLDDPHGVHPSFEALYERILRNFTRRGIPKAEHAEALTVNVLLDAEQVATGGVVSVGIPVYERCSFCRGVTTESLFTCPYCSDERMLEKVKTIAINFPAYVRRGTMLEAPLRNLGIENLFLRLYVTVSHHV